jgi:transposase
MTPSIIGHCAVGSAQGRASTSVVGPELGKRRWPVERSDAWILENRRLALRYDRLGLVIQSLLQAPCILPVAGRLAREF